MMEAVSDASSSVPDKYSGARKRRKTLSMEEEHSKTASSPYIPATIQMKLQEGKFGSVTKEIEALFALRSQVRGSANKHSHALPDRRLQPSNPNVVGEVDSSVDQSHFLIDKDPYAGRDKNIEARECKDVKARMTRDEVECVTCKHNIKSNCGRTCFSKANCNVIDLDDDIESRVCKDVKAMRDEVDCETIKNNTETHSWRMSLRKGKCNVIDLDNDGGGCVGNDAAAKVPVVVIDSDDEKCNESRMVGAFQEIYFPKSEGKFVPDIVVSDPAGRRIQEVASLPAEPDVKKDKSSYIGMCNSIQVNEGEETENLRNEVGCLPTAIRMAEIVYDVADNERMIMEESHPTETNIEKERSSYTGLGNNIEAKEAEETGNLGNEVGCLPTECAVQTDKTFYDIAGNDMVTKEENNSTEPNIKKDESSHFCQGNNTQAKDGEPKENLMNEVGCLPIQRDKIAYDAGDHKGINEDSQSIDTEEDGLGDIWKEMAFALESSKDAAAKPSADEHMKMDREDCDHSFILREDIGEVCRICGIIQRSIDSIIEFQYHKDKRSRRSYAYERDGVKDGEPIDLNPFGVKFPQNSLMDAEISAHPKHRKEMKAHQVEGFKFLCSNLLTEDPGGCILAHAPGSGKTFMVISFIHSYLAQNPDARPLIVMPKGILGTWKKEFVIWQVEDIPLHDFYTSKADSRSQQLDVLRNWVNQRSILFLGYKQFSTIVCDNAGNKGVVDCKEILLKVPTLLILDEGHLPRNAETEVLQSLARVQTPLKVVLSGTLYQNHVKEVFNILNLVRPKFLKFKSCREVINRIMSRVQIPKERSNLRTGTDSAFFDLVEYTLQNDEDLKRRKAVIQDLREMTSKVLHFYKGDFLDDLPGLVDFTVALNLSARQKDEVLKLRKLSRFKQTSVGSSLYMHPQLKYLSEKYPTTGERGSVVDDEKIDAMLEELEVKEGAKLKFFLNLLVLCESTGEKLLVFSQYILPLKLLERLSAKRNGWSPGKELFTITGDSNTEKREWCMERFNNSPSAKVFFGSIKACGEGISLVAASRIIVLDVHLNPSVTRQAIGRAFRPGQKKKVYVYRLVAADSPEQQDYLTCCRKELISKMWFEWNEHCGDQEFEAKIIDVNDCEDVFLESPGLREDIKVLYRR